MTDLLVSLQESGLSTWLRESDSLWALPTILTLHTLGLAVLVGSSWAFDLRVLGMGRTIPLGPYRTMFKVMWAGFWINFVTGLLLFAADAERKAGSTLFLLKMSFVIVGVVMLVMIRKHVYGSDGAVPERVSSSAKVLALVSIAAWTAAIGAGRLLAYLAEY
jgi:hypothetical protein